MDEIQARLEAAMVKKGGASKQGDGAGAGINSSHIQALLRSAQLALDHWKEVDIEERRKGWETSTLEVANAQEASSASRKALAESTKSFRKLEDAEKLAGWGALLKGYQAEIDSLTKRSKAAELAFLGAFKALRDVPDPAPLLGSLVEEIEGLLPLQGTYEKVNKELAEYKEEFQSLKNQDVTIRRLEEKIAAMHEERAKHVQEAVEEARVSLEQRFVERREKEQAREQELQAQVKDFKAQIVELNRKHDEQQSGAIESQSELEQALSARQAQVELLSEEVDRLTAALDSILPA